MDIKTETANDDETQPRDEKIPPMNVNELKVLLLDVILPLVDILVDIAKCLVLVFEDQHMTSYESFSEHFLEAGLYGLVSIIFKWSPALVAGLHFQDMNR